MWETLGSALGNSHFEAYVGGPLAGVLMATIFTAFMQRTPPKTRTGGDDSSAHNQGQGNVRLRLQQVSQQDNNGTFLLMVAMFFSTIFFVAFLPMIAFALYTFISSLALLSITATVGAALKGRFVSMAWWLHVLFPFVTSVFCVFIAAEIEHGISPEVTKFARGLIGERSISVAVMVDCVVRLFRGVGINYVLWMMCQMAAFMFVSFSAVHASLQIVHYVALENARATLSSRWYNLAVWTARFATWRTVITICIFLGLAWLLSSGAAYRLWLSCPNSAIEGYDCMAINVPSGYYARH